MAITQDDFKKIWASTSSVPEYTFSDADYQDGWEFVGNLPPTRAMWDTLQRRNDQKMKYLLENVTMWVDSVSDLRSYDASVEEVVATKGYYTPNDGGNSFYVVRADASDTDDGGSVIILDNGNVAELITDGTVNVKQFGAAGDGVTDDADVLQYVFSNFKNVKLNAGDTYYISHNLDFQNVNVYGCGATIFLPYYDQFTSTDVHKFAFCVYDNVNIYDVNVVGSYTDNTHRWPAATESGDAYDQGGLTIYGSHTKLNGCTFKYIRESAILVLGDNISNVLVENCTVTESGLGFNAENQSASTGQIHAIVVRNSYFDANGNVCGIGNILFDTCVFEQMRSSSVANFNVSINDAEVPFPSIATFINCDFINDYTNGTNLLVYGYNQNSIHMHRPKAVFIGCRISGETKRISIYIYGNAEFHSCVFRQDITLAKTTKNAEAPGVKLLLENCEMMRWGSGTETQYLVNNYSGNDAPAYVTMIGCYTHDLSDSALRLLDGSSNMILAMINCSCSNNNTTNITNPVLFFGNRNASGTYPQNSGVTKMAQYRWLTDINTNSVALDASLLTDATFKANAHGVYYFTDTHVYFIGNNKVVQLD